MYCRTISSFFFRNKTNLLRAVQLENVSILGKFVTFFRDTWNKKEMVLFGGVCLKVGELERIYIHARGVLVECAWSQFSKNTSILPLVD